MAKMVIENSAKGTLFFQEMKPYARYLLDNRLAELGEENLRMLQAYDLPLLKFFRHLPEAELLKLVGQSVKEFLQDVTEDHAYTKGILSLIRWKENGLEGIPHVAVETADLVLTYSIRKRLLLKFLPYYTANCSQVVAIAQELEYFFSELEQRALEVFLEIKQEELNNKNDFLSSLVNNSEDAIMAFDQHLGLTEWNPIAESLFGKRKEAAMGQRLDELCPEQISPAFYRAQQQALKGERVKLQRQPYPNRKGSYDLSFIPLHCQQGSVSGVLCVLHDITEAVMQEEVLKDHQEELQTSNEELQESLVQLEETQEVLRAAVEQLEEAQAIAHLGNWEYDVSRNLIFWSKELRRIFGITEETLQISYGTYLELIHPDDREQVSATIAKCFEDNEPYAVEHRIVRSDGSMRWIYGQGKAVSGAGGVLLKLSGTAIDVTERKLSELKVIEEQHFIQKIADTTPDVITVFDLEKRVNIYGNRQLYEVLGYNAQEVEEYRQKAGSQWVYSLLHPEDLPRFFAFIESLRSYHGTEAREIEYRGKTKAGAYLWVLGRYNVFKRNEKGQVVQIIGVTRDITVRKKSEELIKESEAHLRELNNKLEEQVTARTAELSRKNQQLIRINTDLDNFIYTASHDLKAPIANLEGLLSLLDIKIKSLLSEREQHLLDMMHQSVMRFKKTIKDLTDIAHMQKELEEETAEAVAIEPLLDDIQADISQLIEQAGASLQFRLEVSEIGYNRKNLRSVLHNLITNAIKYRRTDAVPQVRISTRKLGDYVVLQVADNGQGIPEKQQEKVFSLFKRLHKNIEGSGMGLYIVKRIIENSGGRIEVASEPEKGSVFTLYLKDQAVHEK